MGYEIQKLGKAQSEPVLLGPDRYRSYIFTNPLSSGYKRHPFHPD